MISQFEMQSTKSFMLWQMFLAESCLSFVFSNESNIFYMLYEKWLNFELLRIEPQCMLFFWSSDYSRRACAFHPGSNKSDFVPVEYSTFFSSSNSTCGWVEMEAELERQACSCVFEDLWECVWTSKAHGSGLQSLGLSSLLSNAFPVCWPAQSHKWEAIWPLP